MHNIVTIDGVSACGKSTLGYCLSQTIGYRFLDAGMIYRAGCVLLLNMGVPIDNDEFNGDVFRQATSNLRVVNLTDGQKVFLGGEDITSSIATPEITRIVSEVGSRPLVREVVRSYQTGFAAQGDCIMAGRNVGSEIFPEANLKFFLTASLEVRALRRYRQLIEDGISVELSAIHEQITTRDAVDSTRKISPLRIPEGAIVIDTTQTTFGESLQLMENYFYEKVGVEGSRSRRI